MSGTKFDQPAEPLIELAGQSTPLVGREPTSDQEDKNSRITAYESLKIQLLLIGHVQERLVKLSTDTKLFNIRPSLINHFARSVLTEQTMFFSRLRLSIIGDETSKKIISQTN